MPSFFHVEIHASSNGYTCFGAAWHAVGFGSRISSGT
jgi:hypothetical protein